MQYAMHQPGRGCNVIWTVDEYGSSQVSESGYEIRKQIIRRDVGQPREFTVYRAFSPTGRFLCASGEREAAEECCVRHLKGGANELRA
jgi:hypothetical protein